MKDVLIAVWLGICFFSTSALGQTDIKKVVGLLVDNTGSLRTQLDRELKLAKAVNDRIETRSAVSLYGFATEASGIRAAAIARGIQCSQDRDAVNKQIDNLHPVPGQTKLLDAIRASADVLNKSPGCDKATDLFLVIITDGEDRASETKQDELFKIVQSLNVRIFAIGLLDGLQSDGGFTGKSPSGKAKDFLQNLAKGSNGNAVFPKKNETPEEIVEKLFEANSK